MTTAGAAAGGDDCPIPAVAHAQPTILARAAHAARMADLYCAAMDDRRPFVETMRAAGALARATTELTTAIADRVAEGNGRIVE